MKQKLTRVCALALAVLTIISLLAGCKREEKLTATQASEMNDAACTIGVPAGTTAENAVESALPQAKTIQFNSLSDAYLAVQQGKVDAFAFDRYLLGFAIANGLTGVRILPGDVGGTDDVAVGISRNSAIPDLQGKINDCLAALQSDGTLDEMFQRWVVNADDTMPDIPTASNPDMTLTVATSGTVQPFSYYQGDQLTGYDLELAQRLALAMNAELVIKIYDYDGFPSAAEAGAIDCILANLNATPERRETMDFSTPLYRTQTALLVRDDGAAATAVDLETANYGVMTGSTGESYVLETYPNAQMSTFASNADSFAALAANKVDYVVTAYTVCQNAVQTNSALAIYRSDLRDQEVGMAVSKDNPALLEKLNGIIEQYASDGTLDEICQRWLHADGNYTPVDIPEAEGKNGTLTVAMTGNQEPFNFLLDGTYQGADCELIARIAYDLDMKISYQTMQFGGLIAALSSGKADVICSAMAITEERKQTVNFTDPYLNNPLSIACRKEDLPAQSASDNPQTVSPETARYGITSVVAQDYLTQRYPQAKLSMFPAAADALLALESGKLDYVMTSRSTAGYMMRAGNAIKISQDDLVNEACYIAVSKQQPQLCVKVDEILSKFKADGTLGELCGRWALDGPDYYRTKYIEPAIGTNGILKVALSPDVPPICFVQDGQNVGINVELIELIARELDMKVEFSTMDFDALLPAIQSGKVDLAISDINATDERRQLVDFTQSYFDNPQVLVTREEIQTDTRVPEYTELSQLSGKVVSAQTGTVVDILVDSAVQDVTYSFFNNRTDQLAALESGKVEAFPCDEPVALLAVAQNPDLTILPQCVVEDHYGVALQKDSPLTPQVNDAIAQLKADGTLDAMREKWSGSDEAAKVLPQLDCPGTNGTLRVAHDTSGEPMEYVGTDGTAVGYDLELMLRIAQILDYQVEWISVDFSGLIPMLQSGKADAAVGCMSITEERKQVVDMSDSYYDGGLYFVVRKVDQAQSTAGTPEKTDFFDGLKASFTRTFVTEDRWKLVLDGLEVTVLISVCAGILGSLMGFGICMLRRSKKRLASVPAAVFIRIIQGTPIVVLLMILYYIIFGKVDISAIAVAIFGFAVNFGVYVSEMMRTGIDAVDPGQIEAAQALGFTKTKTFWKITFPQAARHFLPVFKGEFISMVKMTSVVGYIAIQDLTKVSDIIRSRTLEAFFPLIATAVLYFLVANLLTLLLARLEVSLDPKRRARTVKGVVMK
ncbi:MAG: ABC transporter permease subunit [Oscillibacter sp.]|jgi:polar amino acid transport system substrate-binding protein|nr:ABC transporter permease subunit [Oscillibacter sp.]